ncbi:hypothetical protein [Streptomyces cinnamoneus]|uniref:Uncharacterized protein n=1 Tax=Streptomyces cinnamoneus TaxID=53446 RepID=A0A918WC30_STRCJ|nr:hypothetical protein [Streptomyces cinnamoneus]GHC33043.1 hypothetical protein GCM10010507_01750 [Streptomyces cinnamoneus]
MNGPNEGAAKKSSDADAEDSGKPKYSAASTVALVTLLGLLMYGVARFGNAAFCARLGISPDEIGVEPHLLLGKVAGTFVLFVLLIGLTALVIDWVYREEGGWWRVWLVGIPVGAALAFLFLAFFVPGSNSWIVAICLTIIICLMQFGSTFLGHFVKSIEKWSSAARGNVFKVCVSGATVIVALFILAGVSGYRAAGYTSSGRDLPHFVSFYFWRVDTKWLTGTPGFLGIHAKRATISWVSSTVSERVAQRLRRGPVFHLGTYQGVHYLYCRGIEGVIRFPASLVVIETWTST